MANNNEKMLNTAYYQRNANQSYNKISPTLIRMVVIRKNLQIINSGEDVEKKKPSNTVGGNVNGANTVENTMEDP